MQWSSVGVTGGVPVSTHSETGLPGSIYYTYTETPSSYLFQAPNDLYQKPYAVGPEAEFRFPLRLSLAVGMEYERFHRDFEPWLLDPPGSNYFECGDR